MFILELVQGLEMAQGLRALGADADDVSIPAHRWLLTALHNSCPRASSALWRSGSHMLQINNRKKKFIDKINKSFQNYIMEICEMEIPLFWVLTLEGFASSSVISSQEFQEP